MNKQINIQSLYLEIKESSKVLHEEQEETCSQGQLAHLIFTRISLKENKGKFDNKTSASHPWLHQPP